MRQEEHEVWFDVAPAARAKTDGRSSCVDHHAILRRSKRLTFPHSGMKLNGSERPITMPANSRWAGFGTKSRSCRMTTQGTESTGVLDARNHRAPFLRALADQETFVNPVQRIDFDSIDGDVVADFHWNRQEVRPLEVGIRVDEPLQLCE